MAQLILFYGELPETGVHQCFLCLRAHLLLGENDMLREPVASERLDSLGTRVWRIGDVTEVWSRAENLECLSPRAPSLGAQRWSVWHPSASS